MLTLFAVQMHAVAKNIFNYIAVLDLASSEGLALAVALGETVADGYPVRVGLLPALPPGATAGHSLLYKFLSRQSSCTGWNGSGRVPCTSRPASWLPVLPTGVAAAQSCVLLLSLATSWVDLA